MSTLVTRVVREVKYITIWSDKRSEGIYFLKKLRLNKTHTHTTRKEKIKMEDDGGRQKLRLRIE